MSPSTSIPPRRYPMVLFTQCTRQEIDVALEATGIPEAWFVLVVDASSPIFEAAGGSPPGLKVCPKLTPVLGPQCAQILFG